MATECAALPVLVGGATGAVGSETVRALSQAGVNVLALCRDLEKASPLLDLPGVELVN